MDIDNVVAVVKGARCAAILPHVSADGDALGSSLALALVMEKLGMKARIIIEESIPFTYSFLPGMHLLSTYEEWLETADAQETRNTAFDLVVALDTGDMERLGKRAVIFNRTGNTVNIDHHQTNTRFAACNYVGTEFSAVGEMIYLLIKKLAADVDGAMAICLYVAISTDTGGFRYSNTTPLTHRITADLLELGTNVADISQRVFETMSLEKAKLMGKAVDSLELFEDGKISIIVLTDEMMRETGARDEDCDGIVNIGRNIRGVEATALLRPKGEDEIRINLRSNNYIDVSAVAHSYAGGGHKKAAGCTVKGNIGDVKQKIVRELKAKLKS